MLRGGPPSIHHSALRLHHLLYIPPVRLLSHLTRLRRSKSESILPAPSTTEESGSSAMETGRPVSMESRLSRFLSSAPPPVRTMPRSTMSAESSGGVLSRSEE